MEYDPVPLTYQVIYSRRKTLGLTVRQGQLIVRAPMGTSRARIERAIQEKRSWIEKHMAISQAQMSEAAQDGPLTSDEIRALGDEAMRVIPERVRYWAPRIGVSPRSITIRNQRTRWGSCSAKGNLNFNCLLMLCPPDVLDSIVVHELCHLKEMNHSERFYQEVYRVFPDYDRCDKWLKAHGAALLARMG